MPFTLKGHSLCSRIFETMQIETLGIKSASSALAARHGEGKTRKHTATIHVSVCVCVCLMFVCCLYSGIIEHTNMGKILIEVDKSPFQMDLQLFTSRVNGWRKSYTIWEYDHHIHYLYFFVIRFSTSEVVLNFFHHQHPPRLFLWLPRVSNSIQFLDQRNLSNDLCVFLRHLLWESKCSFKFWPPFSVPPALAEFTTSAIVPSYWMDGIHAVCLNNSEKSCHGASKTRSFTIQLLLYPVHSVACTS